MFENRYWVADARLPKNLKAGMKHIKPLFGTSPPPTKIYIFKKHRNVLFPFGIYCFKQQEGNLVCEGNR